MATTPSSTSGNKWSALSIHERIRAMNDTLDSVEKSHMGGEDSSLSLVTRPTTRLEEAATRRSSVVDIWRQREACGESPIINTEKQQQQQQQQRHFSTNGGPVQAMSGVASTVGGLPARGVFVPDGGLADTTTGTTICTTDDASIGANHHQQQEQQMEQDEIQPKPPELDEDVPRMARRPSHCPRGIASASPAPPPLPVRRPAPLLAHKAKPPPHDVSLQPADITIVPSPSNRSASSAGSSRSNASRRSTKVLQAWEKMVNLTNKEHEASISSSSMGGSPARTITTTAATTTPPKRSDNDSRKGNHDQPDVVLEDYSKESPLLPIESSSPMSEKRRSVVDIWKIKANSPKTIKSWVKDDTTTASTNTTPKPKPPAPILPKATKPISPMSIVTTKPDEPKPSLSVETIPNQWKTKLKSTDTSLKEESATAMEIVAAASGSKVSESSSVHNRWTAHLKKMDQHHQSTPLPPSSKSTKSSIVVPSVPKWKTQLGTTIQSSTSSNNGTTSSPLFPTQQSPKQQTLVKNLPTTAVTTESDTIDTTPDTLTTQQETAPTDEPAAVSVTPWKVQLKPICATTSSKSIVVSTPVVVPKKQPFVPNNYSKATKNGLAIQPMKTNFDPSSKAQPHHQGSVLDRWKVAATREATATPQVIPSWKKKTLIKQPPVELPKPVLQDEPTSSETDIPSEDEMTTDFPVKTTPLNHAETTSTIVVATAAATQKSGGKITDRWLQTTIGNSTSKPSVAPLSPPPLWAKPVKQLHSEPLAQHPSPLVQTVKEFTTVSEPSVETAEASSVISPVTPAGSVLDQRELMETPRSPASSTQEDAKSESLSSPSHSPRYRNENEERSTFDTTFHTEERSIPSAIECCESTEPVKTASSIVLPNPTVSKLVKEFGHRTPIATPRQTNDRMNPDENNNINTQNNTGTSHPIAMESTSEEVTIATALIETPVVAPSREVVVPEHVSGLVKNLGARTPSVKKRLSIADRWTTKVSTSKSSDSGVANNNQFQDSDGIASSIQKQPSDEEQNVEESMTEPDVDTKHLVQQNANDTTDSNSGMELLATRDLDDKDNLTPSTQDPTRPFSTSLLTRSGVSDRWKKRVATAKEKSPDKSVPSTVFGVNQDITPMSTVVVSSVIGVENESFVPEHDNVAQKLSFSSDAQSNPETKDVEVVLTTFSHIEESTKQSTNDEPNSRPNRAERAGKIVEDLGMTDVANEEAEIDVGNARSILAGRRSRKFTKSRSQKTGTQSEESKSEVGNQRRYPDFQRLVDRSRTVSSSLSPVRQRSTESSSSVISKRDEPPASLTPPRIPGGRLSRPASAPRPKMSKDSGSVPANASSSPIDLITSWNQKLTSTQVPAQPESTSVRSPTTPAVPKSSGKVKKSNLLDEKVSKQRSKKNFAQLGRKHAAKRPPLNSECQDEDSVEEELTQRAVQQHDNLSQKPVKNISPSKYLAFRETESVSPLDSRRFSSTPVMSNRRSSFRQNEETNFEYRMPSTGGETSTSRKLAIEKAIIKKRLNSRRRSRDNRVSPKSEMRPSESATPDQSFRQESSLDLGDDYDAILLPDSGTASPATPGSDFDQVVETTSSTVSTPSLLANKAERLLQERRRKGHDPDGDRTVESHDMSNNNDMEDFANRVREGIPSQDELFRYDESCLATTRQRSDDSSTQGIRSLSSRYNVSSRFIDNEAELSASSSMHDAVSNEESSCVMSADSTAATPSVPQSKNRKSKSGNPQKRRSRSKPSDNSVASDGRSINTGTMSGWDTSRVSDIASLMSFDLKKFASAVDERVAVLRDFVGGPLPDGHSHLHQDFDMEMEDVAIEVEYVEDDGDEMSNAASDLCSSQSGDELMRRGYV